MDVNHSTAALVLVAHQLLSEFSWRLDEHEGRGVADLFDLDGTYELDGRAVVGREAISKGFKSRAQRGPRTALHLNTNIQVTDIAETGFSVRSIMVVFAADGHPPIHGSAPLVVARVEDKVARRGDAYLFVRRRLKYRFVSGERVSTPADTGEVAAR